MLSPSSSKTKTRAVALTIAIWTAAIGSTCALVAVLSQSPKPPLGDEALDVATRSQPSTTVIPVAPSIATTPPIKLASRGPVRARHPKPPPRDISEMTCSEPKALAMGPVDQSVRYCE